MSASANRIRRGSGSCTARGPRPAPLALDLPRVQRDANPPGAHHSVDPCRSAEPAIDVGSLVRRRPITSGGTAPFQPLQGIVGGGRFAPALLPQRCGRRSRFSASLDPRPVTTAPCLLAAGGVTCRRLSAAGAAGVAV